MLVFQHILHTSVNIVSAEPLQEVYIVGGHIKDDDMDKGNVFTVPSNIYAEFNIFLDPLGAKTVFESTVNITLVPLGIQRCVSSFENFLETLCKKKRTPELLFARRLLSRLYRLKQSDICYKHVVRNCRRLQFLPVLHNFLLVNLSWLR